MTLKPEHIVEALNKKTFDEIDPDEVLKHYGYKPEEVRSPSSRRAWIEIALR